MSLLYGLKCIQQSTDEADAHIIGYNTARSGANAILFDIWNASTSAGREFTVDKDGKMYSGALTEGDLIYAVAGGITGVKRLDSLAIGTANQILHVNAGATAPEWTSALTVPGLLTAAAGVTVSSGVVSVPDGAVGVPGFRFTSEATGFYMIAPGILGLSVAGTLSLSFNAGAEMLLANSMKLTCVASVSGRASLRLPHGTAPSSPVDGDMWTTTAGLYVRINGATVGPLS
jgi:hypothetical protein